MSGTVASAQGAAENAARAWRLGLGHGLESESMDGWMCSLPMSLGARGAGARRVSRTRAAEGTMFGIEREADAAQYYCAAVFRVGR